MRSPRILNPACWIMARISPACPAATASGLMIEKVRSTLIGCRPQMIATDIRHISVFFMEQGATEAAIPMPGKKIGTGDPSEIPTRRC